MRPTNRREILQGLLVAGVIGSTVREALADDVAGWPAQAFKQKSVDDVLKTLFGKPVEISDKIQLDVPEIAENGAVVPISVTTKLPKVTAISIIIPENPSALAASYTFGEGTAPSVGSRLKMAKTSDVLAVIESDGKLYSASKQVKVTLGGCGG